jgi:hypothetical protein
MDLLYKSLWPNTSDKQNICSHLWRFQVSTSYAVQNSEQNQIFSEKNILNYFQT